MNRRKWLKTLFGAVVATTVPLPEFKAVTPVIDPRLPKILIFPELLASEIVGVQPMDGPVGEVFHLTYKYDKRISKANIQQSSSCIKKS
jgi:hypothetical protein